MDGQTDRQIDRCVYIYGYICIYVYMYIYRIIMSNYRISSVIHPAEAWNWILAPHKRFAATSSGCSATAAAEDQPRVAQRRRFVDVSGWS